ncbi:MULTISPECIES: hypothetical protein [Rhizobium]|uniref:Uncharacterized protein n=2 Tax=Rhizobium TaxID=379 RepID=W6RLW9_9HYPH|nr:MULTISPECIES: hypothetical protein [Rhizobium]MCA0805835.1 hypothetical protein [Rhizobium sp. T1473]MCS0459682.1 hypothetical protein [Rhizobium favelukesii]UFS80312.1 hypothetical protein LPB79_03405 [Rhizobium sp. T136]CDM62122.1 hypothetical protein LPU83_pLPU83d_0752 [Rhizobium favelukesii]
MKTRQRQFVVEIKGGRRLQKAQAASIWGGTDLKALAREVEDKAPHLFSSTEAPHTQVDAEGGGPTQLQTNSVSGRGRGADGTPEGMPSAARIDVEGTLPQKAEDANKAVVAQMPASGDTSEPQPASKNADGKSRKRKPARETGRLRTGKTTDLREKSEAILSSISLDEVIALDAENRRLKRLWAEHLHRQNLQLKKMLERFGVA